MDAWESNADQTELVGIARDLRAERPELSATEAKRIKAEVRRRIAPTQSSTPFLKGNPMKARLTIVLALALGVFASASAVTLGVTALSSSDSAAISQYGDCKSDQCGGTLGESGGGSAPAGTSDQGVGPSNGAGQASVNPTAQLAASSADSGLPFTGFVAIPLLLVGLALLGGGVVLGRRLNREES